MLTGDAHINKQHPAAGRCGKKSSVSGFLSMLPHSCAPSCPRNGGMSLCLHASRRILASAVPAV